MFRRRLLFGRPFVRRPILGATLVGGFGYFLGRRSSEPRTLPASPEDSAHRLEELIRLHDGGAITDEEYAAKRADLVREL